MKLKRGANLLLCAGVAVAGLCCLGCSPASTAPEANAPGAPAPAAFATRRPAPGSVVPRPTGPPAIAQVAESDNAFGRQLFLALRQAQPDQNLFISPVSVALALQMTYNGASGRTQAAMARVLDLSPDCLSLNTLNSENLRLLRQLTAEPDVKLLIANSLWIRQGAPVHADFLTRVRSSYRAAVEQADFANPGSIARINDWVSQHTAGKIPTIIDSIGSMDVLLLINATYFKGAWAEPFHSDETQSRPFHPVSGPAVSVPMMRRFGKMRYAENRLWQTVALPYAGGRVEMVVVLPRPGVLPAQALEAHPSDGGSAELPTEDVDLQLPRFEMTYGVTLNAALGSLGMKEAFDPRAASFERMSSRRLYISNVIHKTFVKVNEEGTEAAAATSVRMAAAGMAMPRRSFSMVVDRPFYFMLRDRSSGAVLFIGQVMRPSA